MFINNSKINDCAISAIHQVFERIRFRLFGVLSVVPFRIIFDISLIDIRFVTELLMSVFLIVLKNVQK